LTGLYWKERVCAVVAARTATEMMSQIRLALAETRTLELRLDYLATRAKRQALFAWLSAHRQRAALIATCRRAEGGGLFQGSREEQIEVLAQAVKAGCGWCDLEVETAERVPIRELRRALSPARILISYHNFRTTPSNLQPIVRRLRKMHGDAIKIATQSRSVSDSARVCELARSHRDVVAIPMGEFGLAGRVLSLRMGSALAYAAVEQATAPGQLSLQEMTDLYRAERIAVRSRVYGVIGNPIGHSLSPLLHNMAFSTRKLDAVFVPFLVRDLREFLAAMKKFDVRGLSVTIPHKEAILRYLDDCDPLAARIGAINTVVVRGGGRLYGYNTDYVGVLRSLERRMQLAGSRVLLLGAGGAARAAAFALAHAGSIACICARRPARARELARASGGQAIPRADLAREYFDAIVNCTPVGMHSFGRRPAARGDSPLTSDELNCRIVMDMVYRPRETQLLRLARRKGLETISGVEMFLAQAFAQYEIWTGQRAPEREMRRAVESALDSEERNRK
jgi:3-dehydroquinate dehydratase / shikimate dehydrogenase